MQELMPYAEKAGALLKARGETIAVAESSTGGLIAAALLAVPGASAYFKGGAVVYTRDAVRKLLNTDEKRLEGHRSSEAYTLLRAQLARELLDTTWALSEAGTAGPTGSRYGWAAGHTFIAVSGPLERAATIETGKADRVRNMYAFATAALELLVKTLETK
jgi:nicotinamide-nucleotide amidase